MPQISQQDVSQLFKDFGVDATQAELAAFTGMDSIDSEPLIADFALAKKAEMDRQTKDPLNAYISMADNYVKTSMNKAQTIYDQMQSMMSTAPQLFGSLTPDQVDEYLGPLKNEFNMAQGVTEGAFAKRGLTGSNIEANAIQDGTNKFKESVLSTGLQVGITQKQDQAKAMQDMISHLFSFGGQSLNAEGQAVSQKSAQDLSQSDLIASLPYFFQQSDQSAVANFKAQNSKPKGFLSALSDINTGINLGSNVLSLGMLDRLLPSKGGSPGSFSSAPGYPQAVTPTGAAATGAPGVITPDPAAAALL